MSKHALNSNVAPGDHAILHQVLDDAGRLIVGKPHALRLSLACVLARGHLLIEDVPGVGKTTLAHVLARLLGLDFQRIQFTADMPPADSSRSSQTATGMGAAAARKPARSVK